MAIDCFQLKEYVIRPALNSIGLSSDVAINLLLGTAAQESSLGTYIVQGKTLDNNDALGIFQQQRSGYDYIWNVIISNNVALRTKIKLFLGYEGKPNFSRLMTDHALAAIICRLFYFDVKEPLPTSPEIMALALYWKRYYNTSQGAGTTQQFMSNYQKFVTSPC